MKKWLYYTLLSIFLATFLISSGFLVHYYLSAQQQEQAYDDLVLLVEGARETLPEAQEQPEATADGSNEWITITDPETGEEVEVLPEYAQLYRMNNDLVGWIRLPGTKLNYPVMQTPDAPDYYLKRNFQKESNSHGCIYIKESCDVFAPSDNLTLYGHYMKNGSMFAPLGEYRDKAYWEKNSVLEFDTLRQRGTYEIFSVFITSASVGKGFSYHTFVDAADEADFNLFIQNCKELSLYDTGITPEYGDKLITLSTCDYSRVNGRLVVVARLITE